LRLESLGFTDVYDYVGGKADWSARGLPMEGELAGYAAAVHAIQTDVPTCLVGDSLQTVTAMLGSAPVCIVTDGSGVVLGRVRAHELDSGGETADDIMEEGPSTFRPDVPLEELLERMQSHNVDSVVITDPGGRLIGTVERTQAEALMGELHEANEAHGKPEHR
jgi:CBS domain-containing protein